MADAIRDGNHVPVALGVSSTSDTTTLPFKINSTNGGLITDPSGNAFELMSGEVKTAPINGLVTGQTLLYTVPTGKKLIATFVYFEVISSVNFNSGATFSVGSATGSYTDILDTQTAMTIPTAGLLYKSNGTSNAGTATAGTQIFVNISTEASADVYTFFVRLMGVLVDA